MFWLSRAYASYSESPFSSTSPEVTGRRPFSASSSVVFPAPLGPISPTNSLGLNVKVNRSSSVVGPACFGGVAGLASSRGPQAQETVS